LPSARIADPEGMDASAAVIDHRTLAGGEAYGCGADVTIRDHWLLFFVSSMKTSVDADADPAFLHVIPRHSQDTPVMALTRRPSPALQRPDIPDPYLAVRAADGQLFCRAERDRGDLVTVWPFGKESCRLRRTHIPYP
jgi:hypothetical protein